MQGGGDTTGARATLTGTSSSWFMTSPAANLYADCNFNGHGADLSVDSSTGEQSSATAIWWNKDGIGNFIPLNGAPALVTPVSTTPYLVVVQADNGTSISTFTASEWYDAGSDTCHFTGQVVTTNG
jgi:hypothetical protein